jgi:hypothetical protein
MNKKIYNAILSMIDFDKPLETQISELFFNGKIIEDCPRHAVELAEWINKRVLENYFRNVWSPNWKNYRYSNEGISFKINITNPERVIDIGCGNNLLKGKVNNLVGVDPFNSNADLEIDILELDEPENSFDHAIVFGSINFGDEADIEPRLEKSIGLVKSGGTLFFRVNPGIQHENPNSKWIQFFDWSEDRIASYAQKYNCKVENLHWEREGAKQSQPRIYFELVKN